MALLILMVTIAPEVGADDATLIVADVEGEVSLTLPGARGPIAAENGQAVVTGSVITTGGDGFVTILTDEGPLRVGPNSELQVEIAEEEGGLFSRIGGWIADKFAFTDFRQSADGYVGALRTNEQEGAPEFANRPLSGQEREELRESRARIREEVAEEYQSVYVALALEQAGQLADAAELYLAEINDETAAAEIAAAFYDSMVAAAGAE